MNNKVSYYNHLFTVEKKFYLYNMLSTSIAEIEGYVFSALHDNRIDLLPDDIKEELLNEGFLVDYRADESLLYQFFYDSLRYGESAKNLAITFIPSYNCNLACPYCIQGNLKQVNKISDKETSAVVNFIKNKILESRREIPIERLSISLYGGEPLMNKAELVLFCSLVNQIAKQENLDIAFDMTSNMTLLDDTMIALMEKHQISVQVSIDGTKELHDQRRIKKNGSGTYDIIISNLKLLVDRGLKKLITIRINIDSNNYPYAEEIFNAVTLYSDDIYFGFLTSFKGLNDDYSGCCLPTDCYSSLTTKSLNDILQGHGYSVPQSFGKKAPCSINCRNKYFIDYKLDVYKCEMLLNHPECKVGTINYEGIFNPEPGYFEQLTYSPFNYEECKICKLLPACGGGCPAKEYIDSGKEDGKILMKNCLIDEESLNVFLSDYVHRISE